jgi:hypothetical protein
MENQEQTIDISKTFTVYPTAEHPYRNEFYKKDGEHEVSGPAKEILLAKGWISEQKPDAKAKAATA